MKVLIVDDQYANRYLLEKLLESNGFEVVSAEDGEDALQKMRENPVDLIISDILLPRKDGFQFCKEIKTNPEYQQIPFVFYTAAYTEKKDIEFAQTLGADKYIVKPTEPEEFIRIISDLLQNILTLKPVKPENIAIKEEEYLSEHNQRLIRQLEKKVLELETVITELNHSRERYKNLFENANDAIILCQQSSDGQESIIVEVNLVACTLLKYTKDELIGRDDSCIIPGGDPKESQDGHSAMPVHLTFESELKTKDGVIVPVEISSHRYRENSTQYCLSICRDITMRKKSMAELNRALAQINKNIHQMATIGDKIRNPLTVIMGTCEDNPSPGNPIIMDAIGQIDSCIHQIDLGWISSEKVRSFLIKNYGIEFKDEQSNINIS